MIDVDMSEVHDLADYIEAAGIEPFKRTRPIQEEGEEMGCVYWVVRLARKLVCSDAAEGEDVLQEGKSYKAGWWVVERTDWWRHHEGENELDTSWDYYGPFKTKAQAQERWS